jgi:hypothetical protein
MRVSKVRRLLAENQPVLCTKMNLLDPMVAGTIGPAHPATWWRTA